MSITSKPFYSALSLLLRKRVVDVVTFLSWHFFSAKGFSSCLRIAGFTWFLFDGDFTQPLCLSELENFTGIQQGDLLCGHVFLS